MRRIPYREETDTSSVKRHVTTSLFERNKVTVERELKKGFVSVLGKTRFGVKNPNGRSEPQVRINRTETFSNIPVQNFGRDSVENLMDSHVHSRLETPLYGLKRSTYLIQDR